MLLASVGFGNSHDAKATESLDKPDNITITLHKKGYESLLTVQASSSLVSDRFGEANIDGVDIVHLGLRKEHHIGMNLLMNKLKRQRTINFD